MSMLNHYGSVAKGVDGCLVRAASQSSITSGSQYAAGLIKVEWPIELG
jgi:hypothetical protein